MKHFFLKEGEIEPLLFDEDQRAASFGVFSGIKRIDHVSGAPAPRPYKEDWISGVEVFNTYFPGDYKAVVTAIHEIYGKGVRVLRYHASGRLDAFAELPPRPIRIRVKFSEKEEV